MADVSVIFRLLAQNDTAAGLDEAKSSFAGFGSVLSGILGSEAISGVGDFFSSAVTLADEATKVSQQTAAVLASTGDAAGLTAEQVANLSEKYGELAGVESTQVQNAMNQLLRSSGVDDALKNNTVTADGLTSTLVNMAAAMSKGGSTADSLGGAASALSKALADPFTASKALTAAGDPLTASQVKQIAAFKKTGDTADAYKVILGSLASATNGAAAANTTPLQQMSVKWDDLKRTIGQDVLPMVEKFAGYAISAISGVASVVGKLVNFVRSNAGIFGPLAAGIAIVVGAMQLWALGERLVATYEAIIDALDPYTLIYLGIIAVATVIVALAIKFQGFRDVVVQVFSDIVKTVATVAKFIWDTVSSVIVHILDLASHIPFIGGQFQTAAKGVQDFTSQVDGAIAAVQNFNFVAGADSAVNSLSNMFSMPALPKLGTTIGAGIGAGIPAGITSATPAATTAVQTLASKVQDALTKFKDGIVQSFGKMGSVISNAMMGPNGSSFLVGNLQSQLNKAKQFAADISTLRKAGLNATSLNELIAAGPDQGAEAAREMATAGLGQIGQVNSIEGQLNTLGNNFANQTANDEFGSTAAALKRNQVYLNFDMTGVSTDDFVKALRKAIRVKGGNVQTVLGGAA